jgi:hypothetical protein
MEYLIIGLLLVCIMLLILILKKTIRKELSENNLASNQIESRDADVKANDVSILEKEYILLIKNAPDEKKSTLIRHCFNRLPMSFDLLDLLWKDQIEIISNTESSVLQRNLIIDMTNAISLFRNNCRVEEIDKVDFITDELEKLSDNLLVKLRNDQRIHIEGQINMLEESIKKLSNDKENKEIVKELERLDNKLDKDFLESLPTLKARYQSCSEKLLSIFTDEKEDIDSDKLIEDYNIQAINSHREALKIFEEDTGLLEENKLKKGIGIGKLVKLIGGWDNRYLLPSTVSYTNTIYGIIFSKLKKEAQLTITELMVKEKKKEL